MIHTHTLYRGAPFSGLELDDLRGSGGYGHEMLGSGLYASDAHHVASDYAQGRDACVYELELSIPEDQIMYVDANNMSVSTLESSNAIESDLFGIRYPAFSIPIKNRISGEFETYLISTNEDLFEYEEDLKAKAMEEVLGRYGLLSSDLIDLEYIERGDIESYLETLFEICREFSEEDFEEYEWSRELCTQLCRHMESGVKRGYTEDEIESKVTARLLDIHKKELQSYSGIPNYGEPSLLWGGESTDLASLARSLGYSVLWCIDWISSGDEIVIVDDSIYDNGLTIVDDCT